MPELDGNVSPGTHSDTLQRELNTAPDGVALTEAHTEPSAPRRRLRFYVVALMAAPFLYIAVCLALLRSDFFIRRTHDHYLANLGYGLTLRNADCRILIYGDSSAMVGVDPSIVRQETGLSTCNIAEFAGMTRVNGTKVLDTYLERNRRPEYLVFLFAPEDLTASWRHEGNFEAVLLRVRAWPDRGLLRMVLVHTEDVLSSIEIAGRYALSWGLQKPMSADTFEQRAKTGGRLPDTAKPLTECATSIPSPPDRTWTDDLRARYSVGGTRVLVDVVPVPACDPGLAFYSGLRSPGNGIIDNQLHVYPIGWYTHSGRLHLGSEGFPHLSDEIAIQVNQQRQLAGAK